MSRKRELFSAVDSTPSSKRIRDASRDRSSESEVQGMFRHNGPPQQPKLDVTYGQRSAFPGLEDDQPGNLQYGDEPGDGIEYLRMVRSEARGIPNLLVAPNSTVTSDAYEDLTEEYDHGGYYYEGAYTAAPMIATAEIDNQAGTTQRAYHKSLLLRFSVLRATLKCTPPLSAIEKLSSSHPISFPPNSKKAYKEWRNAVHATDPLMTQLACMDMASSLALIRLLTKLLPSFVRSRSNARIDRIGYWIWAAMGRCWEVGQLNSEEVGDLRELGKISAGALYGFKDRSGNVYGGEEEHEEEEDELLDEREERVVRVGEWEVANGEEESGSRPMRNDGADELAEEEILEAAKRRLQDKILGDQPTNEDRLLSGHVPSETDIEDEDTLDFETRARATLDMVLTIVGELYGQRDLLELRDEWTVEDLAILPAQRTT